jgi:hypothetical protein
MLQFSDLIALRPYLWQFAFACMPLAIRSIAIAFLAAIASFQLFFVSNTDHWHYCAEYLIARLHINLWHKSFNRFVEHVSHSM